MNIDNKIVYRYLGYKGNEPDEHIVDIIELCKQELALKCNPKYVYKVFDIKTIEEGISVIGANLVLSGNSIKRHLKGCDKAVLLCATLGNEADKYIKLCSIQDLSKALVADAVASVAIDAYCDDIEQEIKKIYEDRFLTFRFGLGYGDLPLELEPIFLNVIEAGKKTGVTVSDSFILNPRKSVACVIGLRGNDNGF